MNVIPTTPAQLSDVYKHEFSFTNQQLIAYAEVSGDVNYIHTSEKYASQTEFGKCIVHGYFSISIFSKIYGTILHPDGNILVSQSAKYIKPIFTDTPYLAVITLKEILVEKNRIVYINEIFDAESLELKISGEATLMNRKLFQQ